jgi:hypothetical protein
VSAVATHSRGLAHATATGPARVGSLSGYRRHPDAPAEGLVEITTDPDPPAPSDPDTPTQRSTVGQERLVTPFGVLWNSHASRPPRGFVDVNSPDPVEPTHRRTDGHANETPKDGSPATSVVRTTGIADPVLASVRILPPSVATQNRPRGGHPRADNTGVVANGGLASTSTGAPQVIDAADASGVAVAIAATTTTTSEIRRTTAPPLPSETTFTS